MVALRRSLGTRGKKLLWGSLAAVLLPVIAFACGPTDLSIVKSGPATVAPGGTIVYTLSITQHRGDGVATAVSIVDAIPAGLTFSQTGTSGNCGLSGNSVVCGGFGNMFGGHVRTVNIAFTVPANATCDSVIVNNASVSNPREVDTNPANNSTSFSTTVKCPQKPELTISKNGPPTAMRGTIFQYSMTVTNTGSGSAQNVTITDPLPAGLTFVPASSDASCTLQGANIVCALGTMAPNTQKTVLIGVSTPNQDSCIPVMVTNVATVATSTTEANPNNNSAQASTLIECPLPPGCIEVRKETFSSQGTPLTPVAQFTFKLDGGVQTALNNSNGVAFFQNVPVGNHTVTEVIPQNWNQLSVTPAGGTVTVNSGANCAKVTFRNQQEIGDGDISINKKGPSTVIRGQTFSYTIDVFNSGPGTAQGVTVTDQIPVGLTFVSGSGASCSQQGGAVVCQVGSIAPNTTKTITLSFSTPVQQNCAPVTVQNKATVSSTSADNDASNNTSQTITTRIDCPPPPSGCIEIVKETYNPQSNLITPVAQFTFTLDGGVRIAHNNSAGYARFDNVSPGVHTIAEIVPTGWSNFSVTPAGGQVTVVHDSVCSTVVFKNRQVLQEADLGIVKSGPTAAIRGGVLSYTVTVTNDGAASASNIIVTDAIPAGLTFNAGASSASCEQQGGNIVCQLGSLPDGGHRTVTIAFDVPDVQNCTTTSVTNKATVKSNNPDPALANNTSNTVTTSLQCAALATGCIEIVKETFTINGKSISPVDEFEFVLDGTTVTTNDANGNARFDNVPVGNHFVSENPLAGWTQLSVTPAGGKVNVQSGNSCVAVVFKNRQVPPEADISVLKSGPATVQRGQILNYTVSVTNSGPTKAENVTISDAIPAGLIFNPAGSDVTCGQQGGSVVCSLGILGAGQTRTITLSFFVPEIENCSAVTVQNRASVSTTTVDPNQSNNVSQIVQTRINCPPPPTGCIEIIKETEDPFGNIIVPVPQFTFSLDGGRTVQNDSSGYARFDDVPVGAHTVTEATPADWTLISVSPPGGQVNVVQGFNCSRVIFGNRQKLPEADLKIVKSGPSSVVRGGTAKYTVTVTNLGPSTANSVTISDPIPAGVSFNAQASDPSCSAQGGVVLCQLGNIPSGQSRSVIITFDVPVSGGACLEGSIRNRASVSSGTTDPNLSNNTSQFVTTTILCEPCIEVVKEALNAQGQMMSPVPTFTFTLDNGARVAQNDASGIARFDGVSVGTHTVAETPQSGWVLLSVTPSGGVVNAVAGQSCARVTFRNRQAVPEADVSIVKTGSKTAVRGQNVSYILTVKNNGPDTASNVVVTDAIPAGMTFLPGSSDASCGQVNNDVICSLGNLASGQTRTLTLTFSTLSAGQCTPVTVQNRAKVTSSTKDSNLANNESAFNTTLTCPAQETGCIEILKEVFNTQNQVVSPTPPFTFNLDGNVRSVTSDTSGRARFDNVPVGSHSVTEVLPAGWTQISVTPAGGQVFVNAGGACAGVVFKNRQPQDQANLSITKTGASTVMRGSVLAYSITVANSGPATAQNVVVTDPVPVGLTFNAANSDPSCSQQGNSIVCQLGSLGAGLTRTITIAFNVPNQQPCTVATIQNKASVSSSTPDPNQSNNTSQIVTTRIECPQSNVGCIEIAKETFNPAGQRLTPVAQFSFLLDGGVRVTQNDATGYARFDNVPVGIHSVSEVIPAGWNLLSVTPANGTVTVSAGDACAGVVFKNQQVVQQPLAQCNDGQDNDGDGKVDYPADPGCSNAQDNDEYNAGGSVTTPACNDGLDNDGDGKYDYPADYGCDSAQDTDEYDDDAGAEQSDEEICADLEDRYGRYYRRWKDTGQKKSLVKMLENCREYGTPWPE